MKDHAPEWVVLGEYSRKQASEYLQSTDLPLPSGIGKVTHLRCKASGVELLVNSTAFRAGRVSHLPCCGLRKSGRASTYTETPKTSKTVKSRFTKSLHRVVGRSLKLISQGHQDAKLFLDVSDYSNLELHVNQRGRPTLFTLPPEGARWIKWWELLHLDPQNAPPPPAATSAEEVEAQVARVSEAVAAFISNAQDLLPGGFAKLPKTTRPPASSKLAPPKFVPSLLFGAKDGAHLPYDIGNQPALRLNVLQRAALAVMLMEWSANSQDSSPENLRHHIFSVVGAARPLTYLHPEEWFVWKSRAEEDTGAEPFALVENADGSPWRDSHGYEERLHPDNIDHVVLQYRPPTSVTLPKNFEEHPSKWVWSVKSQHQIAWPDHYMTLPERP